MNNAGIYKFVPLEEITENEFHREFKIKCLDDPRHKRGAKALGPNGGSVIKHDFNCKRESSEGCGLFRDAEAPEEASASSAVANVSENEIPRIPTSSSSLVASTCLLLGVSTQRALL